MFIDDLEGAELEALTAKAIYGDRVNVLVEDGEVFIQHKVGLGLKAQFNPLTSDKIGLKVVQTVMESGKYEIRPAWRGSIAVSNHRMDGNKVDLNNDGKYVRGIGSGVVEACCKALVIEKFGDDLGRLCEGGENVT